VKIPLKHTFSAQKCVLTFFKSKGEADMMPHLYDIYKTEKDILFPMNLYGGKQYTTFFSSKQF